MMKSSELKNISESLVDTFNDAGRISIELYKKACKLKLKKINLL